MNDFAIVAEGYTDQVVIRHVLWGYFEDGEEPVVNFEQPLEDTTGQQSSPSPGGWDQVIKYFELGRFKQALQTNRYLIVHIDTDVLVREKTRLAVFSRTAAGEELSVDALIDAVIGRFHDLIGEEIVREHGDRFIFAIAVHAIECWLLPLFFRDRKKSKITGCLDTLERELKKRGAPPLRRGPGKNADGYKAASRPYTDRRCLLAHRDDNPSLARFLRELDRRSITIPLPE